MRGKEYSAYFQLLEDRITPAHAGKSNLTNIPTFIVKDHPRTCGEKRRYDLINAIKWGSPPHMRGKAAGEPEKDGGSRITPAHAGKRMGSNSLISPSQDHPRTCGEKSRPRKHQKTNLGSPPHMRGKVSTIFSLFS